VVAERGAWPLPLPDYYAADAEHLALYAKMAASEQGFAEYLDKFVYERRAV
jgi:glutaconate CoA-transferase subunit A